MAPALQVDELRQKLEQKNKLIEKKTQEALMATQEKNRVSSDMNEIRDHLDIKDRKISVLQRKVGQTFSICLIDSLP